MGEPRTTREALIAEILGDLDGLLARAEQLPRTIADAETRIARTVTALDDAGTRFRDAAAASSEQTRNELVDFLHRTSKEAASVAVGEQRAALHEAARLALRTAGDQAIRHIGPRLLEHGITALLASILTAGFVLYLVH